jgi:quercetin dioxygenase-like cupin family protein
MIAGKVWGSTEVLISTPLFELHRLFIKPRAACSEHHHQFKHNAFLVIAGTLNIHVEKNDYKLVDVTTLLPRQVACVPPGEVHWFATGDEGCEAYEMYFCQPLSADIIRRTVGTIQS